MKKNDIENLEIIKSIKNSDAVRINNRHGRSILPNFYCIDMESFEDKKEDIPVWHDVFIYDIRSSREGISLEDIMKAKKIGDNIFIIEDIMISVFKKRENSSEDAFAKGIKNSITSSEFYNKLSRTDVVDIAPDRYPRHSVIFRKDLLNNYIERIIHIIDSGYFNNIDEVMKELVYEDMNSQIDEISLFDLINTHQKEDGSFLIRNGISVFLYKKEIL